MCCEAVCLVCACCGHGGEPGADSSLLSCLLRSQETYIPAMVVVLTFLPAPVVLVVAYGFWKKRHMGSEYIHPGLPGSRSGYLCLWPGMVGPTCLLRGRRNLAESEEGQSHPGVLGYRELPGMALHPISLCVVGYNLGSNYAKPWIHLPEGPETLWKPAWSKITQ